MFSLHALKEFATHADPKLIPPSTLLKYTDTTVTIFDKYPKAMYHFLILPRTNAVVGRTGSVLHDLKSLLKQDKQFALGVLKDLDAESRDVEKMIRDEMHSDYGKDCEWKIFSGFHAVPSMYHVHLHVISSDFVSPSLKNKKHWNSFNPIHGFFLEMKDVLSWFDLPDEAFAKRAVLPELKYEPLLKSDLECWRCDKVFPNMPKLKSHLDGHFKQDIAGCKRKRKHEIDLTAEDEDEAEAGPSKIQKQ